MTDSDGRVPHSAESPAAIEVVRSYLDAMSRLDLAAVGCLLHADVVTHAPFAPGSVPHVGHHAVMEFLDSLPSLVAALRFADYRIEALQAAGEVVAEYTSNTSVIRTGRPYRNRYITRFTVRDHQIVRLTEYFDPLAFLDAFGADVAGVYPTSSQES